MEEMRYRSGPLSRAYIHIPDGKRSGQLLIWLTGGNDGSQLPLRYSLGAEIVSGSVLPPCAVIIPAMGYGKNYSWLKADDIRNLISEAGERYKVTGVSLCGWSLGADAASLLAEKMDGELEKVCLISNFPRWKKAPAAELRFIVGAEEKSAARDWRPYEAERIVGCGHEIGDEIWAKDKIGLLKWLGGV